jgi:5-methylcytosine-specific restriction endonuclease McrA
MPVDLRDPDVRLAMWEAHGKQCCYCPNPLLFGDMQIDHIVPQDVLNDPKKWAAARSNLGLPKDFDGQGLLNLLPSCGRCNRVKGDAMLSLVPLRRAEMKKAQIERRIKALHRQAKETEVTVLLDLKRRFYTPKSDC